MRKSLARRMKWAAAMLLCVIGLAGVTGCDKTLQATVQDGVINVSSSLLSAVMQAAMELALEQASGG